MSRRRYIVFTYVGGGNYRNPREVWWSNGLMALIEVLRRTAPSAVAFTPGTCKRKFPNVSDWMSGSNVLNRLPCDVDSDFHNYLDDWRCPYCKTTYRHGEPLMLRDRPICKDCAQELYG